MVYENYSRFANESFRQRSVRQRLWSIRQRLWSVRQRLWSIRQRLAVSSLYQEKLNAFMKFKEADRISNWRENFHNQNRDYKYAVN